MARDKKTILDIVKAVDEKEFFEDIISAKRSRTKIEPAITTLIPEAEFRKRAGLKKREIDIAKSQIMRGKESQEGLMERVRFDIEDLLSPDNLMDNDSIKILQKKLNKYVHEENRLKVDGILGPQTLKSIEKFRNESRYWDKAFPSKGNEEYEEDLREGGGDQGPF